MVQQAVLRENGYICGGCGGGGVRGAGCVQDCGWDGMGWDGQGGEGEGITPHVTLRSSAAPLL